MLICLEMQDEWNRSLWGKLIQGHAYFKITCQTDGLMQVVYFSRGFSYSGLKTRSSRVHSLNVNIARHCRVIMNDIEVSVPLTIRSQESDIRDPPQQNSHVNIPCCGSTLPTQGLGEKEGQVSDIARQLEYRVADNPPVHLSFIYGLQVSWSKSACNGRSPKCRVLFFSGDDII